jgi:multiple sugar transport system substrate-binding protein
MSLLEKANMIKVYCKNIKKSIHFSAPIDLFLVLCILILISSPFFITFFNRVNTEVYMVNLYLSPRFAELFGAEMTEKLLEGFGEQNPDLQIRLLTREQNDISPDIFVFDQGEFNALVAMEALAELNSYTNYETGMRQFAIPLVSFMDLLFYNIDVLSAAGFDRPPKTREEFLVFARTVSGGNTAAGTAISLSPRDKQALSRDIFSWIWAAGGDFWQDENRPAINAGMAGILSFFGSLYDGRILAQGIFDTTGEQRLEEFSQGRIAMMITSSRNIPYLREKMGDEAFGITTVPTSAGRYSIGLSSLYVGINADSEYPDKVWSFLVFLAERAALFCELFKAVPGVISDIIPGDYVRDDPFYSTAWYIFESSDIVRGFSGKPEAEEYENVFFEEFQFFLRSNRTAQDTLAAIQRRWDNISTPQ